MREGEGHRIHFVRLLARTTRTETNDPVDQEVTVVCSTCDDHRALIARIVAEPMNEDLKKEIIDELERNHDSWVERAAFR